jgi:Arc/MetJ family transcription regulator
MRLVEINIYLSGPTTYPEWVKKTTTLTYDDEILHAVEAAMGTRGLKATVDAVFEDTLRRAAWKRLLERHRAGAIELTNDEVETMNTRDPGGFADGST